MISLDIPLCSCYYFYVIWTLYYGKVVTDRNKRRKK